MPWQTFDTVEVGLPKLAVGQVLELGPLVVGLLVVVEVVVVACIAMKPCERKLKLPLKNHFSNPDITLSISASKKDGKYTPAVIVFIERAPSTNWEKVVLWLAHYL